MPFFTPITQPETFRGVSSFSVREHFQVFTASFGTYREVATFDFNTWRQVVSANRDFLV